MDTIISLPTYLAVQTIFPITKRGLRRGRYLPAGILLAATAGLYMVCAVAAASRRQDIRPMLRSSGLAPLDKAADLAEVLKKEADADLGQYETVRAFSLLTTMLGQKLPEKPKSFLDYVLWSKGLAFDAAAAAGRWYPLPERTGEEDEPRLSLGLLADDRKIVYDSNLVNSLALVACFRALAVGYSEPKLALGMASNDLNECHRSCKQWAAEGLEVAQLGPSFSDMGDLKRSVAAEFEYFWHMYGNEPSLGSVSRSDYQIWAQRDLGRRSMRLYGVVMANRLASVVSSRG